MTKTVMGNILFYILNPVNNCMLNYNNIALLPGSACQDSNLSGALPRAATSLCKTDVEFSIPIFLIYRYD